MKKVLIIDDEAAGRRLIREYLAEHPDYVSLGEANNGVDAVKLCNEFRPDLIFLDVQMPGLTGFEVLTHLDEIPRIIFSTAYDKYALEAFEVHAVDYLLKPYTRERFRKAINRLSFDEAANSAGALTESLLAGGEAYPGRILVSKGRKLVTLATEDIVWVGADGDYCRLHVAGESYHSSYGISAIAEKLDPAVFMRVHRSSIVNLRRVHEAHRYGKSYDLVMDNKDVVRVSRYGKSYDLVMDNKDVVRVSRGYMDRLRDITF